MTLLLLLTQNMPQSWDFGLAVVQQCPLDMQFASPPPQEKRQTAIQGASRRWSLTLERK